MKITHYNHHSIIFEENGTFFEHDFNKTVNFYFNRDNSATKLLNSLLAEKVEDFFIQETFSHMALYRNLYEITTTSNHIYLYDPENETFYMREINNLSCVEISTTCNIYTIMISKLKQLLNNVSISVYFSKYNPAYDIEECL